MTGDKVVYNLVMPDGSVYSADHLNRKDAYAWAVAFEFTGFIARTVNDLYLSVWYMQNGKPVNWNPEGSWDSLTEN